MLQGSLFGSSSATTQKTSREETDLVVNQLKSVLTSATLPIDTNQQVLSRTVSRMSSRCQTPMSSKDQDDLERLKSFFINDISCTSQFAEEYSTLLYQHGVATPEVLQRRL
jgi:hypothetical protein